MIKGNTLTFEQVRPHLHKWARVFSNNYFEEWELISEAWLEGGVRFLPKSKIKLASKRIQYDMIDYMRKTTRNRTRLRRLRKGGEFPYFHNFSYITSTSPVEDGEDFEASLVDESTDIRSKDLVRFLTSHSSLSRMEKLIMKLTYIESLSRKDVGRACGCSESRISQIHTNLIARLRCLDYTKITGRTECQ